jgi:hypothetical protein
MAVMSTVATRVAVRTVHSFIHRFELSTASEQPGKSMEAPMPRLVNIVPDHTRAEDLWGVDDEGRIWRGKLQPGQNGSDYISWRLLESGFPRRSS